VKYENDVSDCCLTISGMEKQGRRELLEVIEQQKEQLGR